VQEDPEGQTMDSIGRALARNGIRRGSALDANVRENAGSIWSCGTGLDVGATDPQHWDSRLDTYIRDRKKDPAFATSLISKCGQRIGITEQQALYSADITKIASGETIVFDDRR
jgi:hypothetical protein